MYAMGEAMIAEQPEIGEVRFSLPNKHHFVVDLSPFGLENQNEVFHADDRPYGFIEGTVHNDDAPTPGRRVRPGSGLVTPTMAPHLVRTRDGPTDHPVDEVLPVGQLLLYGLQHVMSMYAGVVAVPLIVGSALNLPFADLSYLLAATLLVSGLATLLQTLGVWRIGAKLPIVQGTSFAAVASMIAIGKDAGGGVRGLQCDLRRHPGRRCHRVPAVRRVQPAAALLPAGGDRVGHHRDRHLAAAGRDPLGRRRRGDRPDFGSSGEHRARRDHPGASSC